VNKYRWVRVTKKDPCQICGKPDFCDYAPEADLILCMRVESDWPSTNSMGGWIHRRDGSAPRLYVPPKKVVDEKPAEVGPMWLRWFEATNYERLNTLAQSLGVSADALCALGCAWNGRAWAFPMKDSESRIIGIRLRNDEGQKWAVKGSKQGLFIPEVDPQKTLYIVEGPTDCAAALSIGLYAIGRPSCLGCEDMIAQFIRAKKVSRAVIVADNDEPGLRGAAKLRSKLPVSSCLWTPPCKDMRAFVNLGGDALLIESSVKDLIWERAA